MVSPRSDVLAPYLATADLERADATRLHSHCLASGKVNGNHGKELARQQFGCSFGDFGYYG